MRTNIADIPLCLLHSSNPKLDLARISLRVKTKHPDYTGYWLFPLPITSTIFRYTLLIKYSVIYLTCVIPTPSSVRMRAEQSILTLIMNVLFTARADIVFECQYYCQWEEEGITNAAVDKFDWNILITSDYLCHWTYLFCISLSF